MLVRQSSTAASCVCAIRKTNKKNKITKGQGKHIAKAAALRINLNIDGTSRLLTSRSSI